jgi:hypothetical protein
MGAGRKFAKLVKFFAYFCLGQKLKILEMHKTYRNCSFCSAKIIEIHKKLKTAPRNVSIKKFSLLMGK